MRQTKTPQLSFDFKEIDKNKVDDCVFNLQCLLGDFKYMALHTEISIGRNKAFQYMLDSALSTAVLASLLSPLGIKYKHMSRESWERRSRYEPYYSALEPRSPYNLYKLVSDYKSRSNSLLLRFKTILELGSPESTKLETNIRKNYDKILEDLKKLYSTPK